MSTTLWRCSILLLSVALAGCVSGLGTPEPRASSSPSSPPPAPTGGDCRAITHYDPASQEAQDLANEYVASFLKEWPTEYMGFEQLWSIDQLDEVIVIQGLVTPEEADVIVAGRTAEGLRTKARIGSHTQIRTRDELVAEIRKQDPTVPAALLECVDFARFLAAASG